MLNTQSSSAPQVIFPPMPDDLTDPVLSPTALSVLERRYQRRDAQGHVIETPKELFWRVAIAVAGAESRWDGSVDVLGLAREFYELMAQGIFLPNSPTLMNAGLPGGQLAACFVLPVGDSMEDIFKALRDAAMVHKSGGGTGFSFSSLRPRGAVVRSTSGVASGPVSFMRIFDTATEQVKQGGKRRGANMGILRVDHPDIMEFICCKEQEGNFENFNISVALTDGFMQALKHGDTYQLIDPVTGEAVKTMDASEVWNELVDKAWLRGDPGVVFIDEINRRHVIDEEIEATNPCGESPLLPYEACNLGSINLSRCVSGGGVAWEFLGSVVRSATRFLDNVIEISEYPVPEIKENVLRTRKIGLGVMGWADMLFRLGIAYDSEEARELAGHVMSFIQCVAEDESRDLGKTRGSFAAAVKKGGVKGEYSSIVLRRNATLTSIAPTGTLSMIADCSSGIEPLYALSMTKTCMDDDNFHQVNGHFLRALEDALVKDEDLPDVDEILDGLNQGKTLKDMGLPGSICRVFKTAPEIAPDDHLKMQAAFQEHVDLAVSKTINLPVSATRADIAGIYELAHDLGCKGVTVYRDECRSEQVLTKGKKAEVRDQEEGDRGQETGGRGQETGDRGQGAEVRKRPDRLGGFTQKVRTGMGELYLTVNELEGRPFEVFATIGKSGRSIMAEAEAIGRLTSLSLRSGVSVSNVVKQLRGIGGESPAFHEKRLLLSTADAVSWVLEQNYLVSAERPTAQQTLTAIHCPECDRPVVMEEGCRVCKGCGWSKC